MKEIFNFVGVKEVDGKKVCVVGSNPLNGESVYFDEETSEMFYVNGGFSLYGMCGSCVHYRGCRKVAIDKNGICFTHKGECHCHTPHPEFGFPKVIPVESCGEYENNGEK